MFKGGILLQMLYNYLKSYLENYKPYKNKWNYEDGCVLLGASMLHKATADEEYYKFVYSYLDERIDNDGNIKNFSINEFNIDNVNPGKVLFYLYDITGEERFKKAINNIFYQLKVQPRTKTGNFWHKGRYPYQVWLDGLYMAQPFYAEYETLFNKKENYSDIFNQFKNVKDNMYCHEKGLYFHGYDETRTMNWAHPETGLSPNFWARAVGWYSMALIDVLEKMSEEIFEYHRELQKMFKELMTGVIRYQDKNTGMWYQVMGFEGKEGNYLETSASAMFAYSLLKGARLGYLPEEYGDLGVKAFKGIIENYLVIENDETKLTGICHVAGLNGIIKTEENRDGSYEYYLSEPIVADDAKGVGPLMMAYSEILKTKMR